MEGVECKVCKNEFTKSEDGGCKLKNCVAEENGQCLKCNDGYQNVRGRCVIPLGRPMIHGGLRKAVAN